MDKQNFHQTIKGCCPGFKGLAGVLTIFIIVLTIFFVVAVFNQIKEGKYIGQDIEFRNTITVTGTGDIYAKPDLGLISFSVITEGKTVSDAMAENTKKMNKIIEFVKNRGVEDKDLKTTSFNIYPRYEYRKVETDIYPYPPGKRVLVGYEVSQQIQVKIRNLDKIGEIIEGAAEAGANQIGSLQFTIDNQDELKKQAREQAIDEAKEKAKGLAKQLGVKLLRIASFSESGVVPVFYGLERSDIAAPVGMGGGVPEVETGENKISVSVNITYEIN